MGGAKPIETGEANIEYPPALVLYGGQDEQEITSVEGLEKV
jgi:hypothetical protein